MNKTIEIRKPSGLRRILKLVIFGIGSLLVIAIGSFLFWALNVHVAEPKAYAEALHNPQIVISNSEGFITIRPAAGKPKVGLLFYPGARVAPEAYVAKLSSIALSADVQIVIGRPLLNLAFFSINQADEMRAAFPEVERWYIGGHSLGGSMACLYASNHISELEGVLLFGTYSGTDISKSSLRVLSINGDRDGVFPPETIAERRHELPSNASMIHVSGLNHAQLGNYGSQPGDREATINDAEATKVISEATHAFFSRE